MFINQAFNHKNKKIQGENERIFFSFSPDTSAIHVDACLLACSDMPSYVLA